MLLKKGLKFSIFSSKAGIFLKSQWYNFIIFKAVRLNWLDNHSVWEWLLPHVTLHKRLKHLIWVNLLQWLCPWCNSFIRTKGRGKAMELQKREWGSTLLPLYTTPKPSFRCLLLKAITLLPVDEICLRTPCWCCNCVSWKSQALLSSKSSWRGALYEWQQLHGRRQEMA